MNSNKGSDAGMTLEDVKAYLEGVNGKEIKLGLEPMTALMEALNWPDENLKIIHITGTNGKGSVSCMIQQILIEAGYKIGMFNSPYFEKPNECIRVNEKMIPDEVLIHYMTKLEPIIRTLDQKGLRPSGFELLTAIALLYFKDEKADFVVLEVGLGGRLDATNVIKQSALSIITKIAKDHMQFLGETLVSIAKEKAGIIKTNGCVILAKQEEVMEVIEEKCALMKATLKVVDKEKATLINLSESSLSFQYENQSYHLNIGGTYQMENAVMAIEAIGMLNERYKLGVHIDSVHQGLTKAKWQGRFEVVNKNPMCIIDGAHNVDGIIALKNTICGLPKRKRIAIVGMLRDKEVDEMLQIIEPYMDVFIVTTPLNPRAMKADDLAQKIKAYHKPVYIEEEIEAAYKKARSLLKEDHDDQIIGFGSLYMIGQLRKVIKEHTA